VELTPDGASLGTRCFALAGLGEVAAARADCVRANELAPNAYNQGMLAFLDRRYPDARRIWEGAGRGNAVSARELKPWLARLPR
jgi:hypothetical protein